MVKQNKSNKQHKPKQVRSVVLRGTIPSMVKQARATVPILNKTQAGAEWLRKYLNPNGELAAQTTSGRVPDGTARRSGCFNIHKYSNITRPADTTHSGNWSLWCVSTNLSWISHIYVADLLGREALPISELSLITRTIDTWDYHARKLNQWEMVNDNLRVMLQVNSAFSSYTTSETPSHPKLDFIKIRQTYKGDTYRFVGSNLQNQGNVIAAKYSTNFDTTVFPVIETKAAASGEPVGDSVDGDLLFNDDGGPRLSRLATTEVPTLERINVIDVPPLDVALLTEADPAAYTGRASNGCYSINYNTRDEFLWHTMGDQRYLYLSPSFSTHLATNEMTGNLADIVFPLWEVGVVAFTGIDPTASIQCETRRGLEFVSAVGGKYANLQADSPKYDPLPISVSKTVAMTLKSGYPAAYNDWGKLWTTIKGALPTIVSLIPGLGPILKPAVEPLIGAVEHLITGGGSTKAADTVSGNPTNNNAGSRRHASYR